MRPYRWTLVLLVAAAGAAGVLVPSPAASADKAIERFTAFAVQMGRTRGTATGTVDIVIERWSTPAERDRLTAALREKGSDGLIDEMRKVDDRVGYIRSGGSLGYPLRFAYQTELASGGRRLVLGTDRPVRFLETRSTLYPFLIIDIRMGANGEGQGKLLPLARVKVHPDAVVEFEDYAIEPVRLTRVRKVD